MVKIGPTTGSAASSLAATGGSAGWPDWNGRAFDDVVRYMNPMELEDAAIAPWVRFNDGDEDDPNELLSQTHRFVQSLHIRYGLEPWISGRGQRIRWPALVRRDCGTCLDVAILYASILLRSQFRPFLIFVEGNISTEGHVIIAVDTRAPLQDLMRISGGKGLPFKPDPEQGRHTFRLNGEHPLPGFVMLDPTAATVLPGILTYQDAVQSAGAIVSQEGAVARTTILDVASAIRQEGVLPYAIPNESTGASAIWSRLPQRYVPPPLSDTEEVIRSVRAHDGRIAILGESGTGKSTIAYATAARWDNGYGWFLNAADRSTLQTELSQVELLQRSRSLATSQIEDDQIALSRAALQRLARSRMPWVLVVDNADREPEAITDLLPNPVWPGQVVIVTSTNGAWSAWADRHLTFGPLSEGKSRVSRASADLESRGRRAIEVDIRERLRKLGVDVRDDDLPSMIALCRGELSSVQRRLAIKIAWAPAAALDVEALDGHAPDSEAASSAHRLEQCGLVGTARSPKLSVTMHRAVAAEVRKWDPDTPLACRERFGDLMANDYLARVLSDHAEESVLRQLIDLAGRSAHAPRALYILSEILESRGMSAESASVAGACLREKGEGLAASESALAVLRVVRHTKNHVKESDALKAGLESVSRVVDTLRYSAASDDKLILYRCMAMQGHLRRQLAKRSLEGEALVAELQGAKELLLASVAGRAEAVGAAAWRGSVERELSLFNIAAISLDLGKCLAAQQKAATLLGDSLRMYSAVQSAIYDIYGHDVNHPRGAAAGYGRALCYYYSALLGVRPSLRPESEVLGLGGHFDTPGATDGRELIDTSDESTLLAAAHEALMASLRERTNLQIGSSDSPDVVKCLRLGIEISYARVVWASASRSGMDARKLSARSLETLLLETDQNFRDDWADYGNISVGRYVVIHNPAGAPRGYERTWLDDGTLP